MCARRRAGCRGPCDPGRPPPSPIRAAGSSSWPRDACPRCDDAIPPPLPRTARRPTRSSLAAPSAARGPPQHDRGAPGRRPPVEASSPSVTTLPIHGGEGRPPATMVWLLNVLRFREGLGRSGGSAGRQGGMSTFYCSRQFPTSAGSRWISPSMTCTASASRGKSPCRGRNPAAARGIDQMFGNFGSNLTTTWVLQKFIFLHCFAILGPI